MTQKQLYPIILLYDGTCGLCARVVKFVVPRDPKGVFRFAALQSETGKRLLQDGGLSTLDLDTFVMVDNGKYYLRSTAALRVLRYLRGAWPLLYGFLIVPVSIRDAVYRMIAGRRYRLFGRSEVCMLPSPTVRGRVIDSGAEETET